MAPSKPTTAAGYNPEETLACERVLVSLLRGFGMLKDTLRLVGGLVPRYLTPERPPDVPAHAGTSDVDIVLDVQVMAKAEGYKALAKQLKDQGFTRGVNDKGVPVGWQWKRQVSEHAYVMVEFCRRHLKAYNRALPWPSMARTCQPWRFPTQAWCWTGTTRAR